MTNHSPKRRPKPALAWQRFWLAVSPLALFFACGGDPEDPSAGGAGAAAGEGGGATSGGEGGGVFAGAGGDATAGTGAVPDACGDGRRTGDEECDDDNQEDGDGCDADCLIEPPVDPACGDGEVAGDEECDDGNLQPGDGCDDRCGTERCGNGTRDAGEECDPPAPGECTASCIRVTLRCGDGTVQGADGEECDDRNDQQGDGCHDCRHECGDERIDRLIGEECERAYSPSNRCSAACQWLPVCGDGEIESSIGEECDPSNGVSCVACRVVDPPPPPSCEGGAGGGGSSAAGQGGSCDGGPETCVPQGASEIVQNGSFDTDILGWAPHSSTAITLRAVDEGAPSPNALEVAFASGPARAVSGAYQCLPVTPGASYELEAQYRIPDSAPAGVAASVTALLYAGTSCDGSFLRPPGAGPEGTVRDAWTPYAYTIDTTAFPAGTSEARLLLRLNVVRPADAEGSRVLWDSVSIAAPGSLCGNCVLDPQETCDDGNSASGDGCGASCELESCGDGVRAPAEACDDGNTVFGGEEDTCTPDCQLPSNCDRCAAGACAEEATACLGLTGEAQAGPRAGTPRSVLCDALRTCVQNSACHLAIRESAGVSGAFLENCYCGSAGEACFDEPGLANGSCRREIEAALETRDPTLLLGRFSGSDPRYPVFGAVRELIECQEAGCSAECVSEPSCGDDRIQDRNFEYTFIIDLQEVECRDEFTHTGRGCSFEECDDENLEPGDGCDQHCFVEACGNYVVQEGEGCDDGNSVSGDGCSADCQAEYTCGDELLNPLFEECDPPSSDGTGHVCSEAEYDADPTQCGCDARCSRLVCGNGVIQRPAEACDPPNDLTCGPDCTLLNPSECEACINDHPDLGPVNETYCNVDAACVTGLRCVVDASCYLPVPAACYCGVLADFGECEAPEFVPVGPCHEEIRAGAGGDGVDNATVLERFFDFNYPTGVAMSILDEATRACPNECFPTAEASISAP